MADFTEHEIIDLADWRPPTFTSNPDARALLDEARVLLAEAARLWAQAHPLPPSPPPDGDDLASDFARTAQRYLWNAVRVRQETER